MDVAAHLPGHAGRVVKPVNEAQTLKREGGQARLFSALIFLGAALTLLSLGWDWVTGRGLSWGWLVGLVVTNLGTAGRARVQGDRVGWGLSLCVLVLIAVALLIRLF